MKWGEKKPEREEKEEEERSDRKVEAGLKHKLGVSHPGGELPAMSPSTSASSLAPRRVSSAPVSMAPS